MDETFRERIGERLLVARRAAGWSVAEASRRSRIDRGTIEHAETAGNIGIDYLERYAGALGFSLEQLCREAMHVTPRESLDVDETVILRAYREGTVLQRDALRAFARTIVPVASDTPREVADDAEVPARKQARRR